MQGFYVVELTPLVPFMSEWLVVCKDVLGFVLFYVWQEQVLYFLCCGVFGLVVLPGLGICYGRLCRLRSNACVLAK